MASAPALPRVTLSALVGLAWPIVISRASQTVVGLSDVFFVAKLGSAAVTATATGSLNAFTLLILPMGITFIVSSFAAQHVGKGDLVAARRFGWYGLFVAAAAQTLSMLAIFVAADVVQLLPSAPDVKELMTGYLQLRLTTAGAAIGIEALANYYGGVGRTRPAMLANLFAMGLNVVLNWVLIWGHFGAPAMGVRGSALASAIATLLAFIGLFVFFLNEGRALPKPTLSLGEFGRMLRFGLPSGVNWLVEFFAYILFVNVVVAHLGTATQAALMGVMQLNSVAFMPAFALASAGSILVGQHIGGGDKDGVPAIVFLTAKATVGWQSVVGLVYLLIPSVFVAFFAQGDDSADVMRVGVNMLMVSALWQVFDATGMAYAEALRAAGDTVFPMVVRIVLSWFVFFLGAWVSVYRLGMGEIAATAWLLAYLVLLAIILVIRFRRGAWRSMELVEGAH